MTLDARLPRRPARARTAASRHVVAWVGVVLGLLGAWVALPPISARSSGVDLVLCLVAIALGIGVVDPRRAAARRLRDRRGRARVRARATSPRFERRQARGRLRLVGALRRDAALRDAAHLRRGRRDVLRAHRRREHRPRGDDADGRVLRHPRRGQARLVVARPPRRRSSRAGRWRCSTPCSRSTSAPTRSSAARRSTSSRSASRATCSSTSTARRARRPTSRRIPQVNLGFLDDIPGRDFLEDVFGDLNLMIWVGCSLMVSLTA